MVGDFLQMFVHRSDPLGAEQLSERDATFGSLGVQLETAPVELQIIFIEQSDQTASLCDVAEGSDEVGIETQCQGHRKPRFLFLSF